MGGRLNLSVGRQELRLEVDPRPTAVVLLVELGGAARLVLFTLLWSFCLFR